MSRVSSQGATVTFQGVAIGNVVGLQVETPQAEVVNMTGIYDDPHRQFIIPTGGYSGGSITVDAMMGFVPTSMGAVGELRFASTTGLNVSRTAIFQSATTEARVGDLVRATLKFVLTDYQPG